MSEACEWSSDLRPPSMHTACLWMGPEEGSRMKEATKVNGKTNLRSTRISTEMIVVVLA